jgi:hypothetical protein
VLFEDLDGSCHLNVAAEMRISSLTTSSCFCEYLELEVLVVGGVKGSGEPIGDGISVCFGHQCGNDGSILGSSCCQENGYNLVALQDHGVQFLLLPQLCLQSVGPENYCLTS